MTIREFPKLGAHQFKRELCWPRWTASHIPQPCYGIAREGPPHWSLHAKENTISRSGPENAFNRVRPVMHGKFVHDGCAGLVQTHQIYFDTRSAEANHCLVDGVDTR